MARLSHLILATALASVLAAPASACTESLFRVGKGVSYRQYQAPLPGNILMVARTKTERMVAEWLASTGHNVQVVENADRLATYLSKEKYDVVLAHYDDRSIVAAQEASAGANVKYIPVTDDSSGEKLAAASEYRQTISQDSSPRDILKAIHRTMKGATNIGASD